MKLTDKKFQQAVAIEEAREAGKRINRKQRRFEAAVHKKYLVNTLAERMDGIGPHPGCSEFM